MIINIVNLNKNDIRLLLTIKIPKENNELKFYFEVIIIFVIVYFYLFYDYLGINNKYY